MLGLVFAPALRAYTPSESTQRVPIKWSSTQIPMIFQHNPTDITATQSSNIVSDVLANWNAVSPLPVVSTTFGNNTFSYSDDTRYFGPGVVAVTILNYDAGVGRVSSGQILVNQTDTRGFCLSSSKSGSTCTTAGAGFLSRVYLGDVVAHEMGHLFGLSHSEVRDSTMLFTTFKGQHTPHADDIAGVRKIYSRPGYGTLTGTVVGGNHTPVFGAHVQAISTKTGIIAAAALSQENGLFSIEGLDLNDTYYIYVEPLNYLEGLPDAYRSAQKDFCPGAYVGSFFEACGTSGKGHPQPLQLTTASPSLDVGAVTIRCQVRVGEDYLREKLASGGGLYEFQASTEKPGEAFVGLYNDVEPLPTVGYSSTYVDTVELDLTQLTLPSGTITLDLKLLTAGIGSALDFSVEIDGPAGTINDADRGGALTPSLESGTLRPKYDRKISYPLSSNPALNLLTVRLKPRSLSLFERAVHMPMETYFVLKDRPWLLVASVSRNGEIYYQNQTSSRVDNATCVDAPYTFAVRANPVSASAIAGSSSDETRAEAQATSCGTWEPPSSGGPGAGPWLATLLTGLLIGVFSRRKPLS
jgi:hypothetical protein